MIELRDICRTFLLGEHVVRALDHVNLTVNAGEYISVMGPSGSGKSTLLNLLGLLDRPDSGYYGLSGTDTTVLTEEQRAGVRSESIGFVFQAYHLVPRLNARENIELPMVLAGIPAAERHRLAQQAMDRLGIADRAHHLPKQLSGGQRQRVALARAIVRRPSIILADEPTGNLDSRSGAEVIELIEELNREGITLLVVTHDSALGARAPRRIRMLDGAIDEDKVTENGVTKDNITKSNAVNSNVT